MDLFYYLLLLVSIVLAVSKSSIYNAYAKKTETTLFSTFKFNAACYGVAAVIAFIALLFDSFTLSLATVICAFFYAAVVFSLQTSSIVAMNVGAMSTTAICVMYGMIIPSLAGPIFWKESFTLLQGIGICVMLVSLWLLKDKVEESKKTASKKWLALAAIAFILSGMAGIMEKIHQSTEAKNEKAMFVSIACVFMFLFSLIGLLLTKKNAKSSAPIKSFLPLSLLSGLVIGIYSITNLTLAGGLDTMIYYPVANGGAMLLTVLVSAIVFKEKIDTRKIIGTVMGIVGIVCLSLPI